MPVYEWDIYSQKNPHTHTNGSPPVIILLTSHSLKRCYIFLIPYSHIDSVPVPKSDPGSLFCHLNVCICLSLRNLNFIKYATCWQGEASFVIHYLTPEPGLSNSEYQSKWENLWCICIACYMLSVCYSPYVEFIKLSNWLTNGYM